ncbi:MAG TPA: nucleotidyltransferase family protein [Candidatus Binataceae bacterium]|nr:nucleotidyltransferase family protein [Candidatus Binataceae bacterium]
MSHQSTAGRSGAPRFDGILLAAGESRRMGYPKPLLEVGGRTFLATIAQAMLEAVGRLVVVVGAHADAVRRAVPADSRIAVAENTEYQRGQLSSIKAGLRAIGRDAAGALIHLADHPMVRPATFKAVIEEHRQSRRPIVIARYCGRRGHPVLFARELFAELEAAPEDQGARVVVAADPQRVAYVEVDDPGVVMDLDTPEELERAGLGRPPAGLVRG